MNFISQKIDELRAKMAAKGLNDPRLLGVVLLAVIGLSVIWNGIGVVQQNYGLLRKIAVLEDENRILELENRNKQIQNEYYASAEFAELKARRVNGKAAAGEQVYIITDDTARQNLKTPEIIEKDEPADDKPRYQKNFEAWIDFFFGDKRTNS